MLRSLAPPCGVPVFLSSSRTSFEVSKYPRSCAMLEITAAALATTGPALEVPEKLSR